MWRPALWIGFSLAAGVVLGGSAGAQVAELGAGGPGYLHVEAWREPFAVRGALDAEGWAARLPLAASGLGEAHAAIGEHAEEFAGLFAVEPPPVSRALLEGSGEGMQRYRGLPGGIVLGLGARACGARARELDGARLEGGLEAGLRLRLADGRVLGCPEITPDALRACLEFAGGERDALVDVVRGYGAAPRLAPPFAESALAPLLVRMDGVPHRALSETRAWRSLIVDRAVRLEARGDALVLTADLEVRFYDNGNGSGWARRVRTLEVPAPDFVGPRAALDLAGELAPLAELAAWLGFLRWAEQQDPAGIAALRAGAR